MSFLRAWRACPAAGALVIALLVLVALPHAAPVRAAEPVPSRPQAPELAGGTQWLNSKPLSMRELRGKVVLVDFWEYTCVNCIRTMPYLKAWWRRYKDKGLVIVGVHTPEFQFARAGENVTEAVKRFGLDYPIVVDSNYALWKAYGNQYWPAKYLVDASGAVRYYHFGEGSYGDSENQIQALLRELNPRVELPPLMEAVRGEDRPGRVCYPVTPELYMGYERGAHDGTLGNREGYHPNQVASYQDRHAHIDGLIYANGPWKNLPEAFISTRESPYPRDWIALRYHAIEANSVMKPEDGKPIRVYVYQDGKGVQTRDRGPDLKDDGDGKSYVIVDRARMYALIKNVHFGQHELRLATAQPGLGVYSFTFTSCEMTPSGRR
jgi:thiol-disulfide isomerase/thioredoxin